MQIAVCPDIVKKRSNELIKMKNTNTELFELPRQLSGKWSLLLHTYKSRQIEATVKDLCPRILKLSLIFPLEIQFLISIPYIVMWCCCIQSSMNHALPHSWSQSLVDGSQ